MSWIATDLFASKHEFYFLFSGTTVFNQQLWIPYLGNCSNDHIFTLLSNLCTLFYFHVHIGEHGC